MKFENKSAKNKQMRRRQRGSMLLDAILAISVLMAVVGYVALLNNDETDKQERMMLAAEQDVIITAARGFMQQRYHDVLLDLFDEADANGNGILVYSMDDLVAEGFLPESYTGGVLKAIYGQDYALLARAVNRSDGTAPQSTMSYADMDPLATGGIQDVLTDGDPANGEMEIESILVTHGGQNVPLGAGGDIVGRLEAAFAGFVSEDDIAKGAYENFALDISGFDTLAEYPAPGRFAGVVSLSSYGVLGADGASEQVIDPFRRCEDVNIASNEYSACIASNEIYTDIILRPYDSDGDGAADVLPAMRNVTMLDCAEGAGTGTLSEFTIDCASTTLTGNFVSLGSDADIGSMSVRADGIDFAGEDVLTRTAVNGTDENILNADRLIMEGVNGGQDMSEAVIDSKVVRAQSTVAKPSCPATTIDGSAPMEPRIYLTPAAYSDPRGRPVVGVRAFADDLGTDWRVRLMVFVAQDFCTNSPASPMPTSGVAYRANGSPIHGSCTTFTGSQVDTYRGDSRADVYELEADFGAVVAQTRCY